MKPLQLFISYSHADEPFLSDLEKHLSTLKRENLLATWYDKKIVPGSNWEGEIDGALENSDIIVFLVSPDFVASEFCIEKEVAAALEKHSRGEVVVIPIVVRPVDWLSTPIGKIQALPKNASPVSVWNDKDQAWLEVVKGLRLAISDLNIRREESFSKPLFSNINDALLSEVERIEILYSHEGNVTGIPTGLHDLDSLIDGIHEGDLIFISSAPVMDRMALLISIINHILVDQLRTGLIFSLRQSKEQIARRLCCAIGRVEVNTLQRGKLEEEDWSNLTFALGVLNDKKIGIIDETSIDVDMLISQIEHFKKQYGTCDLVVIDSLEHVTGGSKPNILATLGRYARTNKIPIIVSSGLEFDPSSRINKRPVLRDVGEWCVLSDDIDIVIFVYQDEKYYPDSIDKDHAELIVTKNLRGPLGTILTVCLNRGQCLQNAKSIL